MLQDIPISTPSLREASSCVLETERLTLRRPTLADVKAIAHLANNRRIAENTRRRPLAHLKRLVNPPNTGTFAKTPRPLPYPYLQDHAVEFVRAMSAASSET